VAREFVVWCDPCMGEDQRTPGKEITIAIDGKPARIAAYCPHHEDQIIKPLAAILEEFGETVEAMTTGKSGRGGPRSPEALGRNGVRHGKPPGRGRPNQCLWCDLSYSSDGGGFGRHLKVAHGFAGFVEAFGGTCPVCGDGEFEAMMAHIKRSHADMNFVAIAEPFIWARDHGDPHGVYAYKRQQQGSLDPKEAWEKTRAAEDATAARVAKTRGKK
jgi:hypothetical protein